MQKLVRWDSPIIAVYSHYESDTNGSYGLLIGAQGEDEIEWYESIEIAKGNYKEYTTQGAWLKPVGELWKKIWIDTSIHPTYTTDYEVYSSDRKNPNISIFIGVL